MNIWLSYVPLNIHVPACPNPHCCVWDESQTDVFRNFPGVDDLQMVKAVPVLLADQLCFSFFKFRSWSHYKSLVLPLPPKFQKEMTALLSVNDISPFVLMQSLYLSVICRIVSYGTYLQTNHLETMVYFLQLRNLDKVREDHPFFDSSACSDHVPKSL